MDGCFRRTPTRTGWIENRNVAIEYRWSDGRTERYAEITAEFVRMKVDVIITVGSAVPTVRQATSVIPIVFLRWQIDTVGSGLCLKPLKIVTVSHNRSEPARPPPQSGHRQDRESATALQS